MWERSRLQSDGDSISQQVIVALMRVFSKRFQIFGIFKRIVRKFNFKSFVDKDQKKGLMESWYLLI